MNCELSFDAPKNQSTLLFYKAVTSWSLFEAVAAGCPMLTNECEATTGTINSPMIATINSISDLTRKDSIELMKQILNSNLERKVSASSL